MRAGDARGSHRRTPKSRAHHAQETTNSCGFARCPSSQARDVARHSTRAMERANDAQEFSSRDARKHRRDAWRAIAHRENSCALRRSIERAITIMRMAIRECDRISADGQRARRAMPLRRDERNGHRLGDRSGAENRRSAPKPLVAPRIRDSRGNGWLRIVFALARASVATDHHPILRTRITPARSWRRAQTKRAGGRPPALRSAMERKD